MNIQCYCTILRSAARRMASVYDKALAPVGINTAQFSLLRAIARTQPAILTELGRRMELDRSTVGRNVRVLERMGLVRHGRGEDQREASITLTDAGEQALEQAGPLWEAAQAAFDARMGPGTMSQLRATLDRI